MLPAVLDLHCKFIFLFLIKLTCFYLPAPLFHLEGNRKQDFANCIKFNDNLICQVKFSSLCLWCVDASNRPPLPWLNVVKTLELFLFVGSETLFTQQFQWNCSISAVFQTAAIFSDTKAFSINVSKWSFLETLVIGVKLCAHARSIVFFCVRVDVQQRLPSMFVLFACFTVQQHPVLVLTQTVMFSPFWL